MAALSHSGKTLLLVLYQCSCHGRLCVQCNSSSWPFLHCALPRLWLGLWSAARASRRPSYTVGHCQRRNPMSICFICSPFTWSEEEKKNPFHTQNGRFKLHPPIFRIYPKTVQITRCDFATTISTQPPPTQQQQMLTHNFNNNLDH